jgi:hypothetical protein
VSVSEIPEFKKPYFTNLFLKTASPAKPEPRRSKVAGSGTSDVPKVPSKSSIM